MSKLEQQTAAVCCSSGTPSNNASTGRGTVQLINGLQHYITGANRQRGIIVAYDIFGFDIGQTRQFVDDLAERANATAIMPDLLRKQPWLLSEFPPPDGKKFSQWLGGVANADNAAAELLRVTLPALNQRLESGAKIGIVGFCWGARVSLTTCASDAGASIACCACLHPAMVSEELVAKLQVPLALLPAEDDPEMEQTMQQLQSRPFYSRCIHRRFNGVQHGFCAARGDRNDPKQMQIINEACNLVAKFIADNA